jgi:hypothetical protein
VRPGAEGKLQGQPSHTGPERRDLNQQLAGNSGSDRKSHNKQSSGRSAKIEKEQDAAPTLSPSTLSPPPPWKSAKRPFRSQQEATEAFWDSLSKVWFTKGALKEFDRKTAQPTHPTRPAPIGQCDWRRISYSHQIKRFARHGGPDLCNLRGVRPICSMS